MPLADLVAGLLILCGDWSSQRVETGDALALDYAGRAGELRMSDSETREERDRKTRMLFRLFGGQPEERQRAVLPPAARVPPTANPPPHRRAT
jgi:hypothetical protein